MGAKIIAFLNFKGGVGNTANTVNIGACLALHHKKKVLVVDLDPQCNSTYWLLRYSEFEEKFSETQVRDFAKILGMKVSKTSKKTSLVSKLVPYLQRHYENTR